MAQVTIFSAPECSSCNDAKAVFQNKGVAFEDVNVTANPTLKEEITQFLGGELVLPQIVIDGFHVGGVDRLKEFEKSGKLDQLLAAKKGPCCRSLPEDQCNNMHRGMGKNAHKEDEAHEHGKEHVH